MPDTPYAEGVTSMDHIKHDMKMGRFPEQSSVETFLAERGATGPALLVSITVMRNMLAGCQIIVGKGLTDEEIGEAEAAAMTALSEEIYEKSSAYPAGDALQSDLFELMTILGMSGHARPQSPHEVFQHALDYLRGRLKLADEAFATLRDLYDAASEGAFVPEEPMDRADRLFRWEKSFREDWAAEAES